MRKGKAKINSVFPPADSRPIRDFLTLLMTAPRGQLALVALLTIACAVADGVGLLLLLPAFEFFTHSQSPRFPWLSEFLLRTGAENSPALVALLLLLFSTLRLALGYLRTEANMYLLHVLVDRFRMRIFTGLVRADLRWLTQTRGTDHVALLVTDIGRIGHGFNAAVNVIASACIAVVYAVAAISFSWRVGILALGGGGLIVLVIARQNDHALRLGHGFGKANSEVHRIAQEGIAAICTNRIFGNEARQIRLFAAAVDDMRLGQIEAARAGAISHIAMQFAATALLCLTVYFGVSQWHVAISTMLPLIFAVSRLMPLLNSIQQGWHHWLHALPALAAARTVLAEVELNGEGVAPLAEPIELEDAVVLDGVTLINPDRGSPTLDCISLRLPARTTIALVGPSGSGKSTLADVVMGIVAADQGKMTIDGRLITGTSRQQWRQSVAYVSQDAFLFHDTIRSNLLWSKSASDDAELWEALAIAAADFVVKLPLGLDTIVGDRGVTLSGGERQRICLARALLRRPRLLILDEATNALDLENVRAIKQSLRSIRRKMTILLICHDEALIDDVDAVIRMRDGRVEITNCTLPIS